MRKAVGINYELTESIEYYFDFQVGTNRIEMEVVSNEKFELQQEGLQER